MSKFLNVQLVILRFWLEIRNNFNHTENAKFKHNSNKLY